VRETLLQPVVEIALSLLIGLAIGFLVALCTRFFHSRSNKLCIIIAAVLLGVALSQLWDLSSLLLCMAIGACYVNLKNEDEVSLVLEQCDRWTPPLFMLFFVISGAELDLAVIPTVGLLGVLYLLARSLGKYFSASIWASPFCRRRALPSAWRSWSSPPCRSLAPPSARWFCAPRSFTSWWARF